MQEVQETWVDPWVRKTSLEESTAIHFSILPWKIPWTEEPGRLESIACTHTAGTETFLLLHPTNSGFHALEHQLSRLTNHSIHFSLKIILPEFQTTNLK